MRQIIGTNEPGINALNAQQLRQVVDGAGRFDHRDDELVVMVFPARITHRFDQRAGCSNLLNAGDHDAIGTQIEVTADQTRVAAPRSDDGGDAGCTRAAAHLFNALFGSRAFFAVNEGNVEAKLSETLDQRCRGIVDQHHGRRFPAGELLLDAQHDGRRSEGGEATNGRAVHQAPLRQLVVANRKVLAPAVVPHQQVADLPAMGVDHFVAHD